MIVLPVLAGVGAVSESGDPLLVKQLIVLPMLAGAVAEDGDLLIKQQR